MTIIFWEHHHQPLDYFHYRCRWPKFEGLFNDFIGPGVLSAGQHYQAELRLLLFRRLQLQQPLNGSKQFVNRPFSDNHLLPEQFRATGLSLSWSSLFYRQHCRLNICCYIETLFRSARASCTTSGEPVRTYTHTQWKFGHLYTGIYATWMIRRLIKPTLYSIEAPS